MAHRRLLHTQALPHRPCQDRAHASDIDAASLARSILAGSSGVMGRPGCAPCHARVRIFPVAFYKGALPYRPTQRPRTRVGSHAHNGRRRCSTWIASSPTWRHARWFRRIRANGRLDLGGCDYYLGTSLRNQMLELHFDADQGCFLGQQAGSDTTVTFAPKGLTKPELIGELGHLRALPLYQLALPFTQKAWRLLAYTHTLSGTSL